MKGPRWQPHASKGATLTVLNRDELFHCLSFLTDDELWQLSTTCEFFRDAFFELTRSFTSYIMNLGTEGYRFSHVGNFKLYSNNVFTRIQHINFQKQYPRLTEVTITPSEFNPINLEDHYLPEIASVQFLTLHNCEYHGGTLWPFPGVKTIDAFRTHLTLPKELNLDTLILRSDSVITDAIPNSLRELRIYSTRVPAIDSEGSNLKRLEIYHPIAWSGYHTYSTRAIHSSLPPLKSLTELKMEIYNPCLILQRAQVLFPNLIYVSVERAAFSRLDLALISPHSKLEVLLSHQNRILGLHHLTPENFPRLRKIGFTGELAELSPLPGNKNLTSLVVSMGFSKGRKAIDRARFPNLEIHEKQLDYDDVAEAGHSWETPGRCDE